MVSRADLRLLSFYSLLCGLFLELYPQQMATAVAPPMGEKGKELAQQAYDRVHALAEEELSRDERVKVEQDFVRITVLVTRIEDASPEARVELLGEHEDEKTYLIESTLRHLHKLRED
jgi:hypothetical protein